MEMTSVRSSVTHKRIELLPCSILFYLASVIMADGTVFFYISAALVLIAGAFDTLRYRKVIVFPILFSFICFALFNAFLILTGRTLFPNVSLKRLLTFLLNVCTNYFIFVFISKKYRENLLFLGKWFVRFSFALIAYILVVGLKTAFSGRFGQDVPYLFGMSGTSDGVGLNSNFVCQIFFIAYSLSLILCRYLRKRRYILSMLCFAFFAVLTGSRTGILVIALFSIIFYLGSTRYLIKKIGFILLFAFLAFLGYLCLTKIPFLYENIGHRFEVLLNGLTKNGGYELSSSAYTRNDMINFGLEMFRKSPLYGYGLDSYSQLSPYGTYSHNNFIEILFSSGAIGFALYYLGIVVSIIQLFVLKMKKITLDVVLAFSLLVSSLVLNISHVDYVDRISLFALFLSSAILYNRKRIFQISKKYE